MADRARGGTLVSVLAPGLPQLLAGRFVEGCTALFMWVAGVAVLVIQPERVGAELGTGSAAGTASLWVLAAAGMAWAWSLWDVGLEEPPTRTGIAGQLLDDSWAAAGLAMLAVAVWAVFAAPILAPEDAARTLETAPLLSPSRAHPMGTDAFGADVLERFLLGARGTLGLGLFAGLAGAALGVLVGGVAGFSGGWIDRVLMRVVDFFIAFPKLVLLIAVVAILEPGPIVLGGFIAFVQWPALARIIRGDVASVAKRDFVLALRALGAGPRRILFRHVLPNVQATILVGGALSVANAMLIEAGLAFLGLGLGANDRYELSWGVLIRDGGNLTTGWWVGGFAGIALVVIVVALHLVADGLRDALDPRVEIQV
ncbi:MAG: ABC transporter permease [Gemmatimonadetes bacterium]|nr:ABC transporter permease [Gemmatimonadota bacterium]